MECICTLCGRDYVYVRGKGGTTQRCSSCLVNHRRFVLRDRIAKHMGGKCEDCGLAYHPAVFDCHHIDAETKDFDISGAHCRRWSVVVAELKKCVFLCANCHRKLHYDTETAARLARADAARQKINNKKAVKQ